MKPDLTGTRIVLRTIGPQDAADLFEIYGDPLTMEFASDPCFTSPAMVAQMMASVVRLEQTGESLEWAIVEREDNKVIGTCGLHSFSEAGRCCEVGCLLNAAYWRRGFMSEALGLLVSPTPARWESPASPQISMQITSALSPCLKSWDSRRMQGAISACSPLSDPKPEA
ncbi:GNAT family N-acetyltransferase [Aeromonas veronii]|uniref:GNAT family N-acetyltransferase n=1 Tax=Aeromonas veronii TaxID=654 RepID=UPI0024467774|nr:GNAT family N-acetyltransferase [Aeromonas veronii]